MYDTFTSQYGLNNLIWVLGYSGEVRKNWYPGDEYVDIVSIDVYNNTNASNIYSTCFNFLKKASPTKLVALTECGNLAKISQQWRARARWLYFAPWYDYSRTNNPSNSEFKSRDHGSCNADWWDDAFAQDYVLSREDFKALRQELVGIGDLQADNFVTLKPEDDKPYDLGGRPWQPGQKGLVIRGGKKYLVR